jgi:deazaflavin-dependent oxidoreductase (nitroreductase family)|tara:strand:+ start:900 stop:1331 length:432 start_codon:yes stop_codon:yes gene_type:complete
MPSDGVLRFSNRLHRGLLGLSGGRLGWRTAGMPVLKLTTVGRRSGQERTVMLTTPHQDGDAIVIVASKGGEDRHPAWYLNLVENPEVKVAMKGSSARPMRARVASSEERDGLWPLVTAAYSGYAGYQEKTDREIPLVVLEPAA